MTELDQEATPSLAQPWGLSLAMLAVVSAGAVTISYLAQPILTVVAQEFSTSTGDLGWIATSAQVGYAVGIVALLPLADVVSPRRQAQVQLLVAAAFLGLASLAQSPMHLAIALFCAGLVSNVAQVLLPLAIRLSPAGRSGRTTAVLTGALLFGVFGGRIVVAWICDVLGWRAAILTIAVLMFVLVLLVRWRVPATVRPPTKASYRELLASLPSIFRTDAALRRAASIQFLVFGGFNALWVVTVLHFTQVVGWSTAQAGLVGLVGIVAAVLTQQAGSIVDRWGPARFLLAAASLGCVSALTVVVGANQVPVILVAMFGITLANQLTQVANQTRILRAPAVAGRTNTIYMSITFLGGATGSALGVFTFDLGGITLTGIIATTALVLATGLAALPQRSASVTETRE
ncbi:MFS transporter [Pseudoclavibacter sp. VKM Ac-2867]|uniref:MFS transporter n=1 Tax=Pseudoclavibacter sp. VKM Ac-2867 TaxID=2783829 RepID=UPI00188D08A1|nr:MFS transporter [Pseudoclavibacter sp. VKM Ac-2867]MBF4459523.1 MFS transporter [Pseudoclavibacter sp. VKM Ac-2867]